jgi:hypothetical protein
MEARLSMMPSPVLELEGTWEEILTHAAQLTGLRVRVTVLYDRSEASPDKAHLSPENQRMLELLTEWEQTSLTDDEQAVLDGLEQHLREEPFTLRQIREVR